jgi:hypothetical protein
MQYQQKKTKLKYKKLEPTMLERDIFPKMASEG